MAQKLKIAVSQCHTLQTLQETISALKATAHRAVEAGVSVLLFPEAYLGGYPRSCDFGATVGNRTSQGREQYLQYFKGAVDLGDTPQGAGDDWLYRRLPVNQDTGRRGDGTRETLEDIARETGIFIVTGVVERTGGSLYCAALYVDPKKGVVGKRRKLMPTGSERLVWSQGKAETLKVVTTTIKGVKLVIGCAICWENMMPLLRYSLYAQNVNLWLAPTADNRDTWEPLMRTIACEQRCFVVSGNQCMRRSQLPQWIINPDGATANGSAEVNGLKTAGQDDFVARGGSLIVDPLGKVLQGPIFDKEDELIISEVDFEDCSRGKLDFDATGHYARHDLFQLSVTGLTLEPPA